MLGDNRGGGFTPDVLIANAGLEPAFAIMPWEKTHLLKLAIMHAMGTEELEKIFPGNVARGPAVLEKYSRDYSIFRIEPEAIVFPRNAQDVERLVVYATSEKIMGVYMSLTARAAGTDMTGGPLNDSVIVDFTKHMNRIKEITEAHAVVEPGVYFRDFEKQLAPKGLLYPPYPASKDLCAIGGMVANDSGGEKTLAYGKTHRYVERLRAVLSDGKEYALEPLSGSALKSKIEQKNFEGEVYRKLHALLKRNYEIIQRARPDVSKNSSGYALWDVWDGKTLDVARLFVGSQGTLGLITEVTLRLIKAKRRSQLVTVFLPSLAPLARIISEILKFRPESLESYDDKTLSVAMRVLPLTLRSMKGNFFSLLLQFWPEAIMLLRGGFPKMVLLAELTGDEEGELRERTRSLLEALARFRVEVHAAKSPAEVEKYWTIRRQSFKLLHGHSSLDAAPFIDDIIVKPESLPTFLPELDGVLAKYAHAFVYTIAGHPGDGNFHIIPLVNLRDPAMRALIPKVMDEVYDLVLRRGGSISAEHNDGLLRTHYLEKMFGAEMIGLFMEIKNIFDPMNIFNPRKKAGGARTYSLEHIRAD